MATLFAFAETRAGVVRFSGNDNIPVGCFDHRFDVIRVASAEGLLPEDIGVRIQSQDPDIETTGSVRISEPGDEDIAIVRQGQGPTVFETAATEGVLPDQVPV